ncbi:unnamed protein product, partial [Amoebophrya sp. A25]|eukprot:GSA25T00022891001.1
MQMNKRPSMWTPRIVPPLVAGVQDPNYPEDGGLEVDGEDGNIDVNDDDEGTILNGALPVQPPSSATGFPSNNQEA